MFVFVGGRADFKNIGHVAVQLDRIVNEGGTIRKITHGRGEWTLEYTRSGTDCLSTFTLPRVEEQKLGAVLAESKSAADGIDVEAFKSHAQVARALAGSAVFACDSSEAHPALLIAGPGTGEVTLDRLAAWAFALLDRAGAIAPEHLESYARFSAQREKAADEDQRALFDIVASYLFLDDQFARSPEQLLEAVDEERDHLDELAVWRDLPGMNIPLHVLVKLLQHDKAGEIREIQALLQLIR